ncbi:YidC/Oxa1 family membrane protein insertase [Amycolatopsis sp. H20-H5]|uniref:YidC/Oxa1 family membrane protein insertase n=1 Tax=Amycolatopsis sp. H20-H5 TaxID=3046309 RepID=UPI002DB73029|nr:membrane protein insertase YidC [Amycolatopsis sp. H20-H5]MEC3979316.1 membrane protein insertase YidC [Amycolatopsis sp. H20-H5]
MFAFLDVPVAAVHHVVGWLATLADPVFGELSTAIVIVAFTAAVRLLLHPLARAAVRGEKARAALAPKVGELRKLHGKDPQRLRRETTELYRDSGTSLFAGCLPMVAQVPFFTVMYRLFASPTVDGAPNSLLGHTLFGAPLGLHVTDVFTVGSVSVHVLVFACLFAALALVARFTIRWQARLAERTGAPDVPGAALMRLLPYGTVLFAAFVPLAAGLYLLTTTTWTAVERAALRREKSASRAVSG